MTETIHCIRGCTRPDHHLSDCPGDCGGCEPRLVDVGILCRRCLRRLVQLLGDAGDLESVAGACSWLADNLGQHIRSNGAPGSRRGNRTAIDQLVDCAAAMSDLQVALADLADDFAQSHAMTRRLDHHPDVLAAWLRPWRDTLATWEPIGDTLDHLDVLMAQAHAVAPWRGHHPDAAEHVAAWLYLAPAEPVAALCERFALKPKWVSNARQRHGLTPEPVDSRPATYRPWDVYTLLHPEAARRHEARLAKGEDPDLVWSSETEGVA